jgi:outer membrane protein assembly factor BamB
MLNTTWPKFQSNSKNTGLIGTKKYQNYVSKDYQFRTTGSIISSPVIGLNGNVYFGCIPNTFYALTNLGSVAWKYVFTSTEFVASIAAIDIEGNIYVGLNTVLLVFHQVGQFVGVMSHMKSHLHH